MVCRAGGDAVYSNSLAPSGHERVSVDLKPERRTVRLGEAGYLGGQPAKPRHLADCAVANTAADRVRRATQDLREFIHLLVERIAKAQGLVIESDAQVLRSAAWVGASDRLRPITPRALWRFSPC